MSETATVSAEEKVLRDALGKDLLFVKTESGDLYCGIARHRITAAVRALRDSHTTMVDYFVECVGVDYSNWPHPRDFDGRFEVVYNLFSTSTNSRVFLKVAANDGETVPTVKDLFLGAEYPEREIQDLFGVIFEGNEPQQGQRFLLPDDWVGYPLRKDHPLGGEDVVFHDATKGPAVEDVQMPHAGESWTGRTGTEDVGGR